MPMPVPLFGLHELIQSHSTIKVLLYHQRPSRAIRLLTATINLSWRSLGRLAFGPFGMPCSPRAVDPRFRCFADQVLSTTSPVAWRWKPHHHHHHDPHHITRVVITIISVVMSGQSIIGSYLLIKVPIQAPVWQGGRPCSPHRPAGWRRCILGQTNSPSLQTRLSPAN